ncbi:SDR family NAD(P)-dependent oxidoreductase [Sphingomonas sp. MMS24-J13]|uniref:SDR family NAD(P)-dependent oxidoreductase n=1 Tax=Sphingomonas sp. MMS24-J13 TaxID=3238686 RepID=UPI00384FF8F0
MEIEGKVAFVTGGASGIGFGIARQLIANGAKVVLADLRQDHLDHALDYFAERQEARNVHGIRLDVTDRAGYAAAADEAEAHFGSVDILVSNAGVGLEGPLEKATFADWDFGIGVNLGGVINGLQTFFPRMRGRGEGHIVNTASLAGTVAMPSTMAIYATAKSAVIALTESSRDGLAQFGIGTTVLCPGPIKSNIHETGQNRPAHLRDGSGFGESEAKLSKRVVSDLWMEPDEVGAMIVDAIRTNTLYVITHGEWREAMEARHAAIMAATPTKVNAALIESLRSHLD